MTINNSLYSGLFILSATLLLITLTISSATARDTEPTGFLKLDVVNIDVVYLVLNNSFENPIFYAYGDSLELPAGNHDIRVVWQYYHDSQFEIEIKPDDVLEILISLRAFRNPKTEKQFSSYPRIHWDTSLIIRTDIDTELSIDGVYFGTGPLIITPEFSDRSIELNGTAFNGKTFKTSIKTDSDFQVYDFYYRPRADISRMLAFLPGVSQLYQKESRKSVYLLTAFLATAGLSYSFDQAFKRDYSEFLETERLYLNASNPIVAYDLGNKAESQLKKAQKTASIRDVLLMSVAVVYVFNIVDAFKVPDIGFRERGVRFDPYLDFSHDSASIGLNLKGNF